MAEPPPLPHPASPPPPSSSPSSKLDARAKRILDQALDLSGAERALYIDKSCAGDEPLRLRVQTLLDAVHREGPFLSLPTLSQPSRGIPQAERAGSRIGPYKLLELIGEGGFGSVFMAEQTEPMRRRVALKVIKLGMDTRAVVARFEQERQALALMDHPNIARVLDGGATETGRPYFVMELVKGEQITTYCDRQSLSIPERLSLFTQVCRAVQHAHSKGIIHRDIKPSNVLVVMQEGQPLCKIIDFGIAKATQHPLTEKTVFTEFRQLIGTPEYMSPEQAAGSLDIDTRSDVYSLGVLLYELLAGVPPLDPERLRSAAYAEMQRMIREIEPPAPSTRLSRSQELLPSIAATRRTEPKKLGSIIRGELDWIVMKALEKDRARRYDSAGNFASDIDRYCAGQAVMAAPPSAVYRARKFVRRHRTAVVAAGMVTAALVVGLGLAVWQAGIASRERDAARAATAAALNARNEAEVRRKETEKVAEFQASQLRDIQPDLMGQRLRKDLLANARTSMERDGVPAADVAARQEQLDQLLKDVNFTDVSLGALDATILQRTLGAIDEQFKGQPLVRARLLLTLGDTMIDLGVQDRAGAAIHEALNIRRRELGDDHAETLEALESLGVLQQASGQSLQAEATFRQSLEGRRRVLGANDRATINSMNSLGSALQAQGKYEEAEKLFRDALDRARRSLGEADGDTATLINNVASVLYHQRRLADAEPFCREALEKMPKALGPDHPRAIFALTNLGLVLQDMNRLDEAEPLLREAMERRRRVLGDVHRQTLSAIMDYASLLRAMGRLAEAEPLYKEVLEQRRATRGVNNPDTLQAMNNMGALLVSEGKVAESEPYFRETLERRRKVLTSEHPSTLRSMNMLGRLCLNQKKFGEAESLFREAAAGLTAALGKDHVWTGEARLGLGAALSGSGKFPEAEVELLAADRTFGVAESVPGWLPRQCRKDLIALYKAWDAAEPGRGHDASAAEWSAKASEAAPATPDGKPANPTPR